MTYQDQIGQTLHFMNCPKRIISLVPSQSEFLWDLGLREELVGITKFCVQPEEMFRSVERVGGTKDLHLEKIRALKPDLIIANKEENDALQIRTLQSEFNVWVSDIIDFNGAYAMMLSLGEILNRQEAAQEMVDSIKAQLSGIKKTMPSGKVAYFIWNNPYMLAAKNTFIDFVITEIGFTNAVEHLERYPVLSPEELMALQPDFCFLSSEPFPFNAQHAEAIQQLLPHAKVIQVDGEMFSWYGSRLKHLPAYLKTLKLLL